MSKFAVVDFYEENLVDYVPLNWVKGKKCFWPSKVGKPLSSAQLKLKDNPTSQPDGTWTLYPIHIKRLCHSVSKSRSKARKLALDPNANLESSEPGTQDRGNFLKRKRSTNRLPKSRKSIHLEEDSDNGPESSSSDSDASVNISTNFINLTPGILKIPSSVVDSTPDNTPIENSQNVELMTNGDEDLSQNNHHMTPPTDNQNQEIIQVFDLTTDLIVMKNDLSEIKLTQKKILEGIVQLGDDIKLLLVASKQDVGNIRAGILKHPAGTLDEMVDLEKYLESTDNYNKVVRYLSCIGGETVKEAVFGVLSRLFTNRFAETVSFCGKNGKTEFQISPLHQLITDSILNTPFDDKSEKVTEKEIDGGIKDWFRTAKGRR